MGNYTIVRILLVQIFIQISNYINVCSSATYSQLLIENQIKIKDSKEKLGKIVPVSLVSLKLYKQRFTACCMKCKFIFYLLQSLAFHLWEHTPPHNLVLLAVKILNFYGTFIELSCTHSLFLLFLISLLILRSWVCSQTPS